MRMPSTNANAVFIYSGRLSGDENMKIDADALAACDQGKLDKPVFRLFQWREPTVTYGTLLDPQKVGEWAASNHYHAPIVKRPTGGGAVYHQTTDLSVSLVWHRDWNFLPSNPRDCYEVIHKWLLEEFMDGGHSLHVKKKGQCGTDGNRRFSACYSEPVCNDVMKDGKKIIGGALRLTKKSILYQGNILNASLPASFSSPSFSNLSTVV